MFPVSLATYAPKQAATRARSAAMATTANTTPHAADITIDGSDSDSHDLAYEIALSNTANDEDEDDHGRARNHDYGRSNRTQS